MDLQKTDPTSSVPPFEQLRTQIAARVASGELAPGTRLPTVRALAVQVGLAVNTVARVYKELEADGVVTTEGRRGTIVRQGSGASSDEAHRAAAAYVATCRRLGLTSSEAAHLVQSQWSGR